MTSSRPYLIRALYEWILDNNLTPYISINTTQCEAIFPKQLINHDEIIIDISPSATKNLRIGNDEVEFDARFNERILHLNIPMPAIKAIFAQENSLGMAFPDEIILTAKSTAPTSKPAKQQKSPLKLVKKSKQLIEK